MQYKPSISSKKLQRCKKLALPLGVAVAAICVLAVVALPEASHGLEEKACYVWTCGIGPCFFDSVCSLPDVGFRSFQWDFGDGAGASTTSDFVNHTFAANSTHNVKLTIKLFGAPGESVTCAVTTAPPVGPVTHTSGSCG